MNMRLLIWVLLLSSHWALGQKTIQFFPGNFEAALEKAKATDKLVFIDTYADWCGPCKMMEKQVFTDSTIYRFFNENFINVKLDVETDSGGEIAGNYDVRVLPTLLFLNPLGEVVHKGIGYLEVAPFLKLAKTALDPDQRLYEMQQRFSKGERSPAFLLQLKENLEVLLEDSRPVNLAFLNSQEDWNSDQARKIIFQEVDEPDTDLFQYLITHKADFEGQFGQETVDGKILYLLNPKWPGAIASPDSLRALKTVFTNAFPKQDAAKLFEESKLSYLLYHTEPLQYANAADDYLKRYYPDTADYWHTFAESLANFTTEEPVLELALAWAQKANQIEKNTLHQTTMASIYYKLGKTKQARKAAQKAIKLSQFGAATTDEAQRILDLTTTEK